MGNRDAVEEGVVVDEDSEGARGDGGCQKWRRGGEQESVVLPVQPVLVITYD